ncbi:MAG: anthranilate phosphoribosyltransferase [Dehalococcoidales bacterium]|jgi:anthranilate phosphoribosyltransferase|nr:anthranilate phosphoribosyltransferase [Dehalococcoidales bacterium]MDP6448696.1 anthranilate phosphoribosyltransferase [Dehalococcoidales bacterium]MDP6577510.1 anthranilate phosphoribosyltransferase [Dehalococcoidales bacterium]MDP6825422.1 anthranilate phosphoribosyltransferase [Dehalococcoidales bacterium]
MIKEVIGRLVSDNSLDFEQAAEVMTEIMSGEATPAQIAAFITALRIKGETVDEIAGLASVMRDKAVPVKATPPVIDTCGTGGDNCASLNVSTAAAFVAAGAGLRVAKHGNRAMTSHCGSADVLEALGVKIDLSTEAVAKCLEEVGIGFMFAPIFHPAMKHAAVPRREIGIRTVFNILGPLTNPARAEFQVIGVPNEELGSKMAAVLHRLGTKHSLIVHSRDGMDEISLGGPSLVWEVDQAKVAPPYEVSPPYFGFKETSLDEVRGGMPEENAKLLRDILDGVKGPGRDVVVMNAAAALLTGNQSSDLKEGARLAEEVINSGRAREKLAGLVKLSQSLD